MTYSREQRRIISLANQLSAGYGPRVRKSLLEAIAVESSFRNLHYGDRDSQGVLQQRPSTGWGPPGNARVDINQYLQKAGGLAQHGFSGTAGQLAQAVQGSAFPGRYDQHKAEAEALLGTAPAQGGTNSVPADVPTVSRPSAVAAALLNPKVANDPMALVQALTSAQGRPSVAAAGPNPPAGAHGPVGAGVVLAHGADRPGVHTTQGVLQFVSQIAGLAGTKLTIGTGTNHNQYVEGTHRQSDHWTGHAADIPAAGQKLTRLGQDALIAAGMPERQARKQRGGLYNVGRYQIIFNSNIGGNHYNHLHVGVR